LTLLSNDYLSPLRSFSLGKRLPQAIYLHETCLGALPRTVVSVIDLARELSCAEPGDFNVVKLALDRPRVSLLLYPRFFEDAFPLLATSWTVDLTARKVVKKTYPATANPPVLHRKEALLPDRHPARAQFEALTKQAEELGLFEDLELIGQKRGWVERLARIGVRAEGNLLVPYERESEERESATTVLRHRTALVRSSLSTPMQALWRHGYLDGSRTVFDYSPPICSPMLAAPLFSRFSFARRTRLPTNDRARTCFSPVDAP
jgi:hypothetical protein